MIPPRLALCVALWVPACTRASGQADPADPPPAARPDQPAPSPPLAAGGACAADADCAVARAIAGLDHVPDPLTERCGSRCYVAVRSDRLEAWRAARARLEGQVPCDRKFARCPGPEGLEARCFMGRCTLFGRR